MQICDVNKCSGCGACVNICPVHCIELSEDANRSVKAKIHSAQCIGCQKCVSVCPVNHLPALHAPLQCYAAWHTDSRSRESSASGGVAAALSEAHIDNNGIVYGAAFKDHMFRMTRAIDRLDIVAFKGSKYVQCTTDDTYSKVKTDLLNGKRVLYFGTPCQIAGLHNFIGPDDNLFTVDLVCHGVPPAAYLNEYIASEIKLSFADISNISFRRGSEWKLQIYKGQDCIYAKPHQNDLYFKAFLLGVSYRDNCYSCPYAQPQRVADITIGDFWGLGKEQIFAHSKEKVSLILVNTPKGEVLLQSVKHLQLIPRPVGEAVAGNAQLRHPAPYTADAQKFHAYIQNHNFASAVRKTLIKRMVFMANWISLRSKFLTIVPKSWKQKIKDLRKRSEN